MDEGTQEILVALTKDLSESRERSLIAAAADLVRRDDGRVMVVHFQEVPDQVPLTDEIAKQSSVDVAFESRMEALSSEFDIDIEADEIVSHDTKHAIVNVASTCKTSAILAEHEPLRLRSRIFGDPLDWVVRHAHCDVYLLDNVGYDQPSRVALVGDAGRIHQRRSMPPRLSPPPTAGRSRCGILPVETTLNSSEKRSMSIRQNCPRYCPSLSARSLRLAVGRQGPIYWSGVAQTNGFGVRYSTTDQPTRVSPVQPLPSILTSHSDPS